MFRSATFRLSCGTLLIIMIISVVIGVAIYEVITRELRASLRRQAVYLSIATLVSKTVRRGIIQCSSLDQQLAARPKPAAG